ncbi:MAG TPA: glycoside hydrolase family 15 protein [Gemmatimonadaceae bacterium]|nr:glycoside hydrolase family 15 protein [Gemmatimonadaceae bacterium]
MTSLDLALVGNGSIAALIDVLGSISWCCFPRFDGDPAFCALLAGPEPANANGTFEIELDGSVRSEQEYLPNTPILVTRFYDAGGNAVEITDFCPRYESGDALVCPPVLVRRIRPLAGRPSVRVGVRPASDYGCDPRHAVSGANHLSYPGSPPLRLTMNTSVEPILDAVPFAVKETITLIFGPDSAIETLDDADGLLQKTEKHWLDWRRGVQFAGEWTDAVVRAAITLELTAYEPTGAIVPSITTSIPEAPNSGRTWDYRYCWPRDAYFTVAALSRVGQLRSTERYLDFLFRVAAQNEDSRLIPIYDLDGGEIPAERVAPCLPGYRGMGPVRVGNKASEQAQHDLYGEAVLSAEKLFDDSARRSRERNEYEAFTRLEGFGHQAVRLHDKPDAGLWELRGVERVHTYSSLMCWVACDRLAEYARRINRMDRADFWRQRATEIHAVISRRSWNASLNAFTATMEGDSLDASLLLMPRLGFLEAGDPRFVGTVAAIEKHLKHGDFVYRYVERDDFGVPENAFLVCTFWYIEALAAMGGARREHARALFEKVLGARNRHGLLAEDLDPRTLEQWGNFPQTYSMAGIIDCALALSEK